MSRKMILRVAFAFLPALPTISPAEGTLENRIEELERAVESQQTSLAGMLGVEVHALASTQYLYSFNRPDQGIVEYRVFDPKHNNVDLHHLNLYLARQRDDEPVALVANLDFGRTAEVVGAVTCWDYRCDGSENDNSFELREAYLTYKAPLAGVTIKAGKFVTLLGYEVIRNYDSFNPNISNSISFGYAIPFTHTGLLVNVPLGSKAAIDLAVVNGWDTVADNNHSKSLLWGFRITPTETFTAYLAGTYGAEQPDNGHSKRAMFTANAVYAATPRLSLVVDGNYGWETDLSGFTEGQRHVDWYGVAGYALLEVTGRTSFHVRAEIFDDPDGVRSGFRAPGLGPGLTAWEITPTIAYQVTKNLLARVEYRHDEADKPRFSKQSRLQDGSDTVAAELLFAF